MNAKTQSPVWKPQNKVARFQTARKKLQNLRRLIFNCQQVSKSAEKTSQGASPPSSQSSSQPPQDKILTLSSNKQRHKEIFRDLLLRVQLLQQSPWGGQRASLSPVIVFRRPRRGFYCRLQQDKVQQISEKNQLRTIKSGSLSTKWSQKWSLLPWHWLFQHHLTVQLMTQSCNLRTRWLWKG